MGGVPLGITAHFFFSRSPHILTGSVAAFYARRAEAKVGLIVAGPVATAGPVMVLLGIHRSPQLDIFTEEVKYYDNRREYFLEIHVYFDNVPDTHFFMCKPGTSIEIYFLQTSIHLVC